MSMFKTLIRRGWRAVTEAHTISWILEGLLTLAPPTVVTSALVFLGEHSIAILAIVFFVILSASALVVLVALGYRAGRKDSGAEARKGANDSVSPQPYLDWPLRDLFGYLAPHLPLRSSEIREHVVLGTTDKRWEVIGDAVLKQLSLGRLHATGVGYRNITQALQPAPIPPEFWRTAKFTYWFLDGEGHGILDAKNADGVEYSDIEVNRSEAMTIWPYPLSPSIDRVPLTEVIQMAISYGWDFSDSSLHLLDLQQAIRQGGGDGTLTVWGKLHKWSSDELMRNELLEKIPSEHWREFFVSLFPARDGDNFNVKSWSPKEGSPGYIDLHLERAQVTPWLTRDAALHKGKTRAR
jgi:hypothetical protein